ncbi:MAG: riboflavin kinase/FMN adenylyltransferase [Myxococcota bacterium]
MQVHRGAESWPAELGPVVTIGNFDGVHLGHRALVGATIHRATTLGAPAVVYTFDPAPVQVLRADSAAPRIQRLDDKLQLLEALGVHHVVVETFTHAFAAQEPGVFAREVLQRQLGAQALVLGWDFRFGRGRGGTVEGMRGFLDIPVWQVEALLHDGEPVSSSRIRRLIGAGELGAASVLLGRPHRVYGTVVRGDARGRTLGFPTANVQTETALLPPTGVYAVRAEIDGRPLPGVANLGRRPTFGGGPVTLEVHLLDWTGDLYGAALGVELVERIRGEQVFSSREALVEQIRADVATARLRLA